MRQITAKGLISEYKNDGFKYITIETKDMQDIVYDVSYDITYHNTGMHINTSYGHVFVYYDNIIGIAV